VEIVIVAVVVAVLVLVQVRRRRSPLQRPGDPRDTHAGARPDAIRPEARDGDR
jgi:hypothetical protein